MIYVGLETVTKWGNTSNCWC